MAQRGGNRENAGRPRGSLNKATIERAEIAALEVEKAKASGRKLSKEYMQDFLPILAGMTAFYQPTFQGMPKQNPNGNPAEFERWLRPTMEMMKMLAPFESPTFRAVIVAPAPPDPRGKVTRFTLEVFEHSGRPPLAGANGSAQGNGKVVEHEDAS